MKSTTKTVPGTIRGVLPEGSRITGDLEFTGGLWIDGCVEGRVCGREGEPSTLVVNGPAVIFGDVVADSLAIHGTVHGNVTAKASLTIAASARVEGEVRYIRLEIEPGAAIRGRLVYLPRAEEPQESRRSLAGS